MADLTDAELDELEKLKLPMGPPSAVIDRKNMLRLVGEVRRLRAAESYRERSDSINDYHLQELGQLRVNTVPQLLSLLKQAKDMLIAANNKNPFDSFHFTKLMLDIAAGLKDSGN